MDPDESGTDKVLVGNYYCTFNDLLFANVHTRLQFVDLTLGGPSQGSSTQGLMRSQNFCERRKASVQISIHRIQLKTGPVCVFIFLCRQFTSIPLTQNRLGLFESSHHGFPIHFIIRTYAVDA